MNLIGELNFLAIFFKNPQKIENIHHCARFIDKGPPIAEFVIKTIPSLVKKPVFLNGNPDWLGELPSVIKKYKNSIQSSIKITTNQTTMKTNEKSVYSNLRDRREKQKPKYKVGDLV